MLPRRESERRIHPLFRHCDILSAIETRISMLNMTYMKYIQTNMCCFIPGKVLDELERVLSIVEKANTPPRTHEILQELRDISSMAMEYFDEKILPNIKGQTSTSLIPYNSASGTSNKAPKVYFIQPGLQEEIKKINKANKKHKCQIKILTKVIEKLYTKLEKQNTTIRNQSKLIRDQETKLQENTSKLQEHENTINDLKKRMDEWDEKFVDFTSDMVRSREDFIKAILFPSLGPKVQPSASGLPKTIIRPRLAKVETPNTYITELERKRKATIDFELPTKYRFIAPRESVALQLKETLCNKINENITQNISEKLPVDNLSDDGVKKTMFPTTLESFLRNPIESIKSRKRRIVEDINLSLD